MAAPPWVRARALAFYLLMFQGGMAAGSAVWGAVAQYAGISVALSCAASGLLLSLVSVAKLLVITGVTIRALEKSAFFATLESLNRKNHEFRDRN